MKHATSRSLFAHWDSLRGERAAPERAEVTPGGLRHLIGDAFVLGLDDGARFRLAGSRLCALFGRELGGASFASVWLPHRARDAQHFVDTVADDATGMVIGVVGETQGGERADLELLLLPLRHGGKTHRRMLGSLAPLATPSWAGLFPIVSLSARSSRLVRSERIAVPDAAIVSIDAAERRSRFVVHEGGLG